jgi:hypothetical protein
LHRALVQNGIELDPELAQAIVTTVAAAGGREEYDAFVERFRNARTPQEEIRYLIALAGFNDLELAGRTFEFALTEVRVQNAPLLLNVLLGNRVAGPDTWRRITENWDEILAKFPGTLVTRMLEGARVLCRDPELANEIKNFLADHPVPSGDKSLDQISERLMVNAALGSRLAAAGGSSFRSATEHLGG